jgi:uncharacterized protein (DUF305 family)
MDAMRTRLRTLPALLILALAVAACGTPEQQASPESGDFSGTDVTFLRDMVVHHEEAVTMAELVFDRTDRDELGALAEQIVTVQRAEVEEMRELLSRAGTSTEGSDAAHEDHDEDGLADLDGTSFEVRFLDRMIAHHRSAVRDAQRHIDRGDNPEVRALAERIVTDQEREIDQMERWQVEWHGAEERTEG